MPYIITTRREGRLPGKEHDAAYSRRAVATLGGARADVVEIVANSPRALDDTTLHAYVQAISESGGTVGPLPDGTVIEVAPWPVAAIRAWAFYYGTSGLRDSTTASIINAYNAAHAG